MKDINNMEKDIQSSIATESAPMKKLTAVRIMRHGRPVSHGGGETYGTDQMPYQEFVNALDVTKTKGLPLDSNSRVDIEKSLENMGLNELKDIKIIFCSSYRRARDTAEVVQQKIKETTGNNIEVRESNYFDEVEFPIDTISEERYVEIMARGGVQGLMAEIDKVWMNRSNEHGMNETYFRAKRALTLLRRTGKMTSHDSVLICTHGIIGRVLCHLVSGEANPNNLNEKILPIKIAEMRTFTYDEIVRITKQ